jgi:tRNA(Arg) A34 adenosine deaminase TadA
VDAPGEAEELFTLLLERAEAARAAGDYGIAAACVLRHGGQEVVLFGQNRLFSEHDPTGHAEIDALRRARALLTGDADERRDVLEHALVRPAPHDRAESILYTTLEPCPMCTVALLNAGVDGVVVAQPDDVAGALLRLSSLTPLWADLAARRGLRVDVASTTPAAATFVPAELLDRLAETFAADRESLDQRLVTEGILPAERLDLRALT